MKVNFKYQTSNGQSSTDEREARLKEYGELAKAIPFAMATYKEGENESLIDKHARQVMKVFGFLDETEPARTVIASISTMSIKKANLDRESPEYLLIYPKLCNVILSCLMYRHMFGTWEYAEKCGLGAQAAEALFTADNSPEEIRSQLGSSDGLVTRIRVGGKEDGEPSLGTFVITTAADHKTTLMSFDFSPGYKDFAKDFGEGKEDV